MPTDSTVFFKGFPKRLRFFCCDIFLDYWGCSVRCETDFVKFWINFDQNNAKEGQPKFDKLKVRGLILMIK